MPLIDKALVSRSTRW